MPTKVKQYRVDVEVRLKNDFLREYEDWCASSGLRADDAASVDAFAMEMDGMLHGLSAVQIAAIIRA